MWEQFNALLAESSNRIMMSIANFLPGLLALVAIVLVTLAVATLVRGALRRSLQGISFDELVAQWGFSDISDWSPGRSPSRLITQAAYWSILVTGLLMAIYALDAELISAFVLRLFSYIPNVLAAILVLVVGTYLARFLARSVLISAVNMKIQSARLLSLGVKWMVMVLTAAMALEHLGIGGQIVTLSFAILFGGIVLALALAVGLGSKDMVSRSWEQSKEEEGPEEHLQHL